MPDMTSSGEHQDSIASVTRCAIYARYSSENQHKESIEDQVRACREYATRRGWTVLDKYVLADEAKSGTSIFGRASLRELLELAARKPKPFDHLLMFHTSRFARNVGEANTLADSFAFFEVGLTFVSDGLNSSDSGFETTFMFRSWQDQQYSKDLSAHVRKGQIGRFDRGQVPGGGIPYGYRTIPHENPNKIGRYGRPEVDWVDWATHPEGRLVIIRIFEMYAMGFSQSQIAGILNKEGVPPPSAPRLRKIGSWSKGAISEMLRNEKYIGIFRWNMRYEKRNPLTGKKERRMRKESERLVKEIPELRIISQDLWERVVTQRQLRRTRKHELGGQWHARMYLLSGLLRCGLCGGTMIITSNHTNPRYGCGDHRQRGTCSNGFTVPQPKLEEALLAALSRNLADEVLHGEVVHLFGSELRKRLAEQTQAAREFGSKRTEVVAQKAELTNQLQNVRQAIRKIGLDADLEADFRTLKAQIEVIDRKLEAEQTQATIQVDERMIRDYLTEQAQNLSQVLAGDPVRTKEELRKRVDSLTLTPVVTDHGRFYEISGDVRLFGGPEGALQSEGLESFGLHYTFPLRLEIQAARQFKRKIPSTGPTMTLAGGAVFVPDEGCNTSDHEAEVLAIPDATQPLSDEPVPSDLTIPTDDTTPAPALNHLVWGQKLLAAPPEAASGMLG
jgi:site-specific DNA recombinase